MDAVDTPLRVFSRRLERTDLVSLCGRGTPSAVFSGPEGGIVGWGSALTYKTSSWDELFSRWSDLTRRLDASSVVPPRAAVSLTFDQERTTSECVLVLPETMAINIDGDTWLLGINAEPALPSTPRSQPHEVWHLRHDDASAYADRVAACLEHLSAGEVEKVVVAAYRDWESTEPFEPADLVTRLAPSYPDCWLFALDGFVGASPELLARVRGGNVESRVLAGSVAPDDLGALTDPTDKLHREHALAATSAVDSLAALCRELDASSPHVMSLSNVAHLATTVTGTLHDGVDVAHVLHHLHPTAAVGGTPTDTAVRLLRELEGFDRGRYAAPVGWIDAAGDGEFVIGLRSGQRMTPTSMRIFAGAGIVEGSKPANEHAEISAKFESMESAFRTFHRD